MPAAYAHQRFGEQCIESLPEKWKKVCLAHYDLFALGVHGPDILFYHIWSFKADHVVFVGRRMHHEPGEQFFRMAARAYARSDRKDEMMAYILGFLTHFALDSYCHEYIGIKVRETGYSHNRIESQYEAYLMRMDGKQPEHVNRSRVLKPSKDKSAVIARFLEIPEKEIYESLRGQRFIMRLLYSPYRVRKRLARFFIRHMGIDRGAGDLFIDDEIMPGCQLIAENIFEHQKRARKAFPEMAEAIFALFDKGEQLPERFRYDFAGKYHRN